MDHIRRGFVGRALLTILVFFFILYPSVFNDVAWVSGEDIPEPMSQESASRLFADFDDADRGYTLIAPYNKKEVYLVDHDGLVVHTWKSDRYTRGTVELLPDGTLIRGRSQQFGGYDGIQILDWNSKVLWDYSPPYGYRWHHDIEPLPNGNFLINTMKSYTYHEIVELGRDPEITPEDLMVDPIMEIRPNGTKEGDIVWMWDPTDHIIQDYDPDKPNYGAVKDHPELMDINYPRVDYNDWQHSNAVSYNAELDQIMITNRNIDEIWVIDHNTTMQEAAGHTGGAHGKGGDILYRWGNPQAYDAGGADDRVLFGPHDAHWIPPGYPGEGNIIVFNNGESLVSSRPDGDYSSVEELVPPVNSTGGYDLALGSAYGPSRTVWSYAANPPKSFYAWAMGGAQRLPGGNTLVCGGSSGKVFEVDENNQTVWTFLTESIFRAVRYYPPAMAKVPDIDAIEDVMSRVDISSYLSDLDTDLENLVIGENSSYANVSGHELLLLYPDGVVTDVINLTVSDGIFEVGREVRVNITPVNDPPELAPIPDITTVEGVPFILDLEPYILDPDTHVDQMNITAGSPFVTVEGGRLEFLYPNGVLTDRVPLTVSDGEGEDRTEILVNVTPVNDPPMVDSIPDQQCVEDVPRTMDLGIYIRDVDSPIGDITVTSSSRYADVSDMELTLLYPDGVTRDVVNLTVSDGVSDIVVGFNVIIVPVNDPPVIVNILPLIVTEGEPYFFDACPAIYDVDTPDEELIIKVLSPYVQVEGHTLILLYPNGINQDEFTIEVWDGEYDSSTTLAVSVEPVNDPPFFKDVPSLTVTEDEPYSFDIGPLISDIDTPREQLTLMVGSPYVYVEGHSLVLLYPDGVLNDEVVVELWDGDLGASTTLVVTVEPVNDPPWWAALPDLTAYEDVEGEFYLDQFMNDIDTPLWELAVDVTSSYGWVEGHIFRFVYPDGVSSEEIIFTLSDGEFQAVLRTNVTITPVNDAPELLSAHVDPPKGIAGTTFKFAVVFKDVDIGSNDPSVLVVIDDVRYRCSRDELSAEPSEGGVVFHHEIDLGPGVHSFHFIADDGDGGTVSTRAHSVAVEKAPESRDGTGVTTMTWIAIVIGAVALVAMLMFWRRRLSG